MCRRSSGSGRRIASALCPAFRPSSSTVVQFQHDAIQLAYDALLCSLTQSPLNGEPGDIHAERIGENRHAFVDDLLSDLEFFPSAAE